MFLSLRCALARVVGCSGAGWSRVVGFALRGLWLVLLSSSALADWPPGSPRWGFSTVYHTSLEAAVTYACGTQSRTVVSSQNDGDYNWSGMCSGDLPVTGDRTWICPEGSHASGTLCVNDGCAAMGGTVLAFDVKVSGGSGACGSAPAYACFEGQCRGSVITASCISFAAQGGYPAAAYWSGTMQMVTSGPCEEGDGVATESIVSPGTSGGGAGVTAGASSADVNATNLARIATNTARLVAGMSSGSSSSVPAGSDGGVRLSEDGVDAQIAEASTSVASAGAGGLAAVDSNLSSLTGAKPTFAPAEGLFSMNMASVFGLSATPDCSIVSAEPVSLPGLSVHPTFGFSFCEFGGFVREGLAWLAYVLAFVGVWVLLYKD